MVQARFDIFGPDAKLVLRADSIFGQTFSRAAYEQLMSLGPLEEGEATVRLAMAECCLQSGDKDRAKIVLVEAAQKIKKLADSIEEASARQSFLTRVIENRRILELREQLECGDGPPP
jgi:hypothetical protein